MFANEERLGDTDGWRVGDEAEVAGKTKAARVSEALAVADQEIGSALEPGERVEEGEGRIRRPPLPRAAFAEEGGR